MMRKLAILGSTGSIGRQALDVVSRYPDRFSAYSLAAHASAEALFEQVRAFHPERAGLVCVPENLPRDVKDACAWRFGEDVCSWAVEGADDALAAVVGIAGLPSALEALEKCERLLLANKEALVTGGELVMEKARRLGRAILPVDSEHSAIFQCLQARGNNPVRRLLLTASGGPFRTLSREETYRATVEQALGHPTWKMGAKITVDCATMMNKGLEVIEAHHLFGVPLEKIQVVVHPQSVIHSMIEFEDGAILAQLGKPDMRGPISYALGYPERLPYGGEPIDWTRLSSLTFEPPDLDKFPCLKLAYQAQAAGGTLPVALNAANEVANEAFRQGRICFGQISEIVDEVLNHTDRRNIRDVQDVYEADRLAREAAEGTIGTFERRPF